MRVFSTQRATISAALQRRNLDKTLDAPPAAVVHSTASSRSMQSSHEKYLW